MRPSPVAGVACHDLAAAKETLVDFGCHPNHGASDLFVAIGIRYVIFPTAVGVVAIHARFAQRGGKESHDSQELIHGNPLEHLNIPEQLLRHLGSLVGQALPVCRHTGEEAGKDHSPAGNGHPFRSTPHVASFSDRICQRIPDCLQDSISRSLSSQPNLVYRSTMAFPCGLKHASRVDVYF
jgi:hypothetical protein